jgi:hypothetical protein
VQRTTLAGFLRPDLDGPIPHPVRYGKLRQRSGEFVDPETDPNNRIATERVRHRTAHSRSIGL